MFDDVFVLYVAGCISTGFLGVLVLVMEALYKPKKNIITDQGYFLFICILMTAVILSVLGTILVVVLFHNHLKDIREVYTMSDFIKLTLSFLFIGLFAFFACTAVLNNTLRAPHEERVYDLHEDYEWEGINCDGGKTIKQIYPNSSQAHEAGCETIRAREI